METTPDGTDWDTLSDSDFNAIQIGVRTLTAQPAAVVNFPRLESLTVEMVGLNLGIGGSNTSSDVSNENPKYSFVDVGGNVGFPVLPVATT
jgi:hypothetical protein